MAGSEAAIAKARKLAPADPLIAFLHAQARYELGYPAAALFADAQRLWPANPDVIRNRALALASEGDFAAAEALLADTLNANPQWLDGHRVLAGLRWTHGQHEDFDRSYSIACNRVPGATGLWLAWFSTIAQHRNWARASEIIDRAALAIGDDQPFLPARAFLACETGDATVGRNLLAQLENKEDDFLNLCRIRFHIRQREFASAEKVATAMSHGKRAGQAWPYLSAIWRATGNPRAKWLDGDPVYASVHDIGLSAAELKSLAEVLRSLHIQQFPYPEQSVRGGTQTDRSVLLRHEPILQLCRIRLLDAVASFVAALPPHDPTHPLLGSRREDLKIAGSWSVRLSRGGHNVAHTHPLGWLSSAFYVALPDEAERGAAPAGHLSLGAPPPELGLSLEPYLQIAPAVGKLVLFPSTLWHSTVPFPAGERLNIAFDVINNAGAAG
jgi:tetratricopeptide (TPR) repeat protein